ncbi:sulfatase-like hydrolase/transferase [Acidobacteria bacterium AH-259-L09]|nr:sulfatase-like hydrolase/transferase [Acidobacteria bacterium AH-259-L09]
MTLRNRFALLSLTLLLGTVTCVIKTPPPGETSQKPNIILAMADDQGWGDMAYNGHSVLKTPSFDEMSNLGLRFDRFYAAAPVCSPTRGSVLTGRHPNRFGCFRWGYSLLPQEITIAQALKTVGYTTGHFGKWHLGSVRSDSPACPGNSGFDEWFSSPNFYENDPWMSHNGTAVKTKGEGSKVTVDAALRFIRAAVENEQPFLAVIWFGSPHSPHAAVEEDLKLYEDQPEEMRHFLGEITAMDRAMGHLRRQLREIGIAENTLLWYTSDNGAIKQGSTGGLSGGKGTLWEGGIRVPAILEWPTRIPSPRTTAIPCGTIDIYPTLLEIAGVEIENQPPLDGISLMPLIDGRMEGRPSPMGFWDYPSKGQPVRSAELLKELAQEQAAGRVAPAVEKPPYPTGQLNQKYSESELPGHAAWIDGSYKLHRIPNESGEVEYALFDLAEDPEEKNDLIHREPGQADKMTAALEAWQKSVIHSLNGEDYE